MFIRSAVMKIPNGSSHFYAISFRHLESKAAGISTGHETESGIQWSDIQWCDIGKNLGLTTRMYEHDRS